MPEIGELLGKGYKMTELGPLPEEWDFLKLKETCLPRKEIIEPRDAISKFYIGLEHIISGKFKINHWGEPKEVKSTKNIFKKGDILYGKLRPYLNKIVYANVEGICSTDIIVLTPKKEKALSTYLAYYLYSKKFLEFATRTMTGVNHPRTSWSKLEDFLIPLPPLPEQQKIAAVLSAVQEAKEKTEAVIRAAKELKKSLMKYLFTYGPVPVDEAEKVRLKQTEIGLVPQEWKVIKINDVVEKTRQKNPKATPNLQIKYIDVSGIDRENLRIKDYKTYYGINAPSRARKIIKSSDIIFASVRPTLKRIAIVSKEFHNELCSTAFSVLRAKQNIINSNYLYFAISRDIFVNNLGAIQRGASYPAVTDKDVKNQFIPFPPLNVQNTIENLLFSINKKIESEESKKQALETLFKSLLNNLMTGKIRIHHLEI